MALLLIPVIFFSGLTGFSLTDRVSELTATIIYGVLIYFAIIFVTWALFSKDRSNQAKSLMRIFRGY